MLTTWAASLSRRRNVPLGDLLALPLPQLCQEIAAHQYALAVETAQATRAILDDGKRAAEAKRLQASSNKIDRIAADLLSRWDETHD